MQRSKNNSKSVLANHVSPERKSFRYATALLLALGVTLMISACGGGSGSSSQSGAALAGNWQFTMTSTDPNYPTGTQYGLQGGFLVQSNSTVSGQALYSIALDQLSNGLPVICDSGSAPISGTVNGQTVTLTAVFGTQTLQLTGTLSTNGLSITNGQFTTTGGSVNVGGTPTVCGAATAQGTPGAWTAISVPQLNGPITGTFHSVALNNQEFQLTGNLTQGPNIGASSATVTGSLNFIDPTTLLTDYPCISSGYVDVTGEISGNTVILQMVGTNGAQVGQIGIPAAQVAGSQLAQVTFDPVSPSGSYILHSTGQSYQVSTKTCNDVGYICLALNNASPCQQPITLSPAALVFSPQLLVCTTAVCSPNQLGTPTTQTITLTNNQPTGAAPLANLSLNLSTQQQVSEFTGLPDFSESDNCSDFLTSSTGGQSCTITITFTPQQSCNWIPAPGIAANCPSVLNTTLTVQSPVTNDNDTSFAVPVTGTGLSYLQPSVGEVDFGAEAVGEASQAQLLSFTNQGAYPVQIVGPASTPCTYTNPANPTATMPRPTLNNGAVGGLAVIAGIGPSTVGNPPTITYACDADQTTGQPNFFLSSNTCNGALLSPQESCSVEISFVPQPFYANEGQGYDYFLQLNTLQCFPGGVGTDCEIDSGRFPVELKANPFSPLRMLPAAGLNFGGIASGKTSAAQDVTLFNDPSDPNAGTVNFLGKFTVSGGYIETDNCPLNLPSGSSCTLSISFKPSSKGFISGTIGIFYTIGSSNQASNPQYIYLRGTGQ
jgi:hypothetical protein